MSLVSLPQSASLTAPSSEGALRGAATISPANCNWHIPVVLRIDFTNCVWEAGYVL